jgi:hypothetical protein
MMYPDAEKSGRGKKSDALNSAESAGFSRTRLKGAGCGGKRLPVFKPSPAENCGSGTPCRRQGGPTDAAQPGGSVRRGGRRETVCQPWEDGAAMNLSHTRYTTLRDCGPTAGWS